MTLSSLLPELLHIAEQAFGPKTGEEKQKAVVDAIAQGLITAGVPSWLVGVVVALLNVAIPRIIARWNADPSNTAFTKSA